MCCSQVNIPKDHVANTHRGFAFIEFEIEEDAKAAVENMDGEKVHVVIRSSFLRCETSFSHTGMLMESGFSSFFSFT